MRVVRKTQEENLSKFADAALERLGDERSSPLSVEDFEKVCKFLIEDGQEEEKHQKWLGVLSHIYGENLSTFAQCESFAKLFVKYLSLANFQDSEDMQYDCLYAILGVVEDANKARQGIAMEKESAYEMCIKIGEKICDGFNPIMQTLRIEVLLRMSLCIQVQDAQLAEHIRTILPAPVQKALRTQSVPTLLESTMRSLTNEINESNSNIHSFLFSNFSCSGMVKSKKGDDERSQGGVKGKGWIDFGPKEFFLFIEKQRVFVKFPYSSLGNADFTTSAGDNKCGFAFSTEDLNKDGYEGLISEGVGIARDNDGMYHFSFNLANEKVINKMSAIISKRMMEAEEEMDAANSKTRKVHRLSIVSSKKEPDSAATSKQLQFDVKKTPDKFLARLDQFDEEGRDPNKFDQVWRLLENNGWTKIDRAGADNGSTTSPVRYVIPRKAPTNAVLGVSMFETIEDVVKNARRLHVVTDKKKGSVANINRRKQESDSCEILTSPESPENDVTSTARRILRSTAKDTSPEVASLKTTPVKGTAAKRKRLMPASHTDSTAPAAPVAATTTATAVVDAPKKQPQQSGNRKPPPKSVTSPAHGISSTSKATTSPPTVARMRKTGLPETTVEEEEKVGKARRVRKQRTSDEGPQDKATEEATSSTSKVSAPQPGKVGPGKREGKATKSSTGANKAEKRGVDENIQNEDDDDESGPASGRRTKQKTLATKSESDDEWGDKKPIKNIFDSQDGSSGVFHAVDSDLIIEASPESPTDAIVDMDLSVGGNIEGAEDDENRGSLETILEELSKKIADLEHGREQRRINRTVNQATDTVCHQITVFLQNWGQMHQTDFEHKQSLIGAKFDSYRDMAEQLNGSISTDTAFFADKVKELLQEGREIVEKNKVLQANGKALVHQLKDDNAALSKELNSRKNDIISFAKKNLGWGNHSPRT